jgi:signal transduction histidine kinase/DNA-binding response OmpR family regulator
MDPRTAFILSTVFMLLNGGVLGLMHKGLSSALQPAAADWRIGTLLAVGGATMLAAQSPQSAWLVLPIGNACLLLCYTLYWRSVRRFDGLADTPWLFAPALLVTLIVTWFVIVQPLLWVRVMAASLGGAAIVSGCIYSLLKHRSKPLEISRAVLIVLFGVITGFAVVRVTYFSIYMRHVDSILASDNLLNVLTPLSICVLPIIGTTAFLVMCTQRLRSELAERAIELDQKNIALTQAIHAREDAERIARHDLKTPLASIAATPNLLRAQRTPDQEEEALLSMIEHAAGRALGMVNLSLDLYRMEQGTYRFEPQPVDLSAIAQAVMRDLLSHARSKQVRILITGGEQALMASGNAALCYSCIANLMKNAVEAASDGSTVTVSLQIGQWRELRIHNDTAIPEALRVRFFEKYATQGKAEGTGLGAYSSQLLAKVQGGSLEMHTSDELGTTLTLRLKPSVAMPDSNNIPAAEGAAFTTKLQASMQSALHILIVDDDPYNSQVLRSQLAPHAAHIHTALNGRYAIEQCLAQRPDVIFMDIQMPVMGGVQAMQRIRELQAARQQSPSQILAFSSDDDAASWARFAQLGFDGSITKPASPQTLGAVMSSVPTVDSSPQSKAEPVRVLFDVWPDLAGFIVSRLQLVQQLDQAGQQLDDALVHSLAHRLSGSLGMYGFVWAADLCAQLESDPQRLERARSIAAELREHLCSVPIVLCDASPVLAS